MGQKPGYYQCRQRLLVYKGVMMNLLKSIFNVILTMAVLAVLSGANGCHDSNSSTGTPNASEVVEVNSLGAYTAENPVELTQANYTVPPSETTYGTFSLDQESAIGYIISDGTIEILDEKGTPVLSDIFFPVGNSYKTQSLGAGTYQVRVQNSTREDISFSIYSTGLPLDCTTIRSSGRILVNARSHEFMEIDIPSRRTRVDLSLPDGAVTLFDQNLVEIASESTLVDKMLPPGRYLLLADNTKSQTRGALQVELTASR